MDNRYSYTPDDTAAINSQNILWVVLAILIVSMVWYATHREAEQKIVYMPAATPTPKPLPPRHLAPEGTFYLLSYLSANTPRGVAGFEPGSEVTLVAVHEDTGSLLVTDGKYQVEAKPTQLTNDMDIAALARNQDEYSQRTVSNFLTNEREAFQRVQQKINQEHSSNVDKINAALVENSVIGRRQGPLNEEPQPASSYDRYLLRNGSPYSYFYHRQYPYYSSPYYY